MRTFSQARFVYIWEYRVKEDSIEEFHRHYGPDGDWVKLFSRAQGYVMTHLYRDIHQPDRFITADYWTSKEARDRFQKTFSAEFAAIDAVCDRLTSEEKFIGDFEIAPDGNDT